MEDEGITYYLQGVMRRGTYRDSEYVEGYSLDPRGRPEMTIEECRQHAMRSGKVPRFETGAKLKGG